MRSPGRAHPGGALPGKGAPRGCAPREGRTPGDSPSTSWHRSRRDRFRTRHGGFVVPGRGGAVTRAGRRRARVGGADATGRPAGAGEADARAGEVDARAGPVKRITMFRFWLKLKPNGRIVSRASRSPTDRTHTRKGS
ncbi:hypothetical protein GCM10010515_03300 [Streptomyces fructofermentans]|uniref:Uncharacterized protein n=1 Tax=Streptomyces fructofermentans TaxID=152141 RepID=A0A918N6N7_9ACTN|nr:hypothetical protein GCM10010515_03300 [Streptomyces fructofermentans]